MEKTMYIKFLEKYGEKFYSCGIIDAGTVFTANEFIRKFGVENYDDIRDLFCDEYHHNNGIVEAWSYGKHVQMWEE